MDRVLLETFKAVVDEGGALKAATVLGCAQSNVTTRLQQLEQRLGVSLFNREGKRLRLSDAGERYLPYAARILALIDEAAANARSEVVVARPLRVGTMESTAAMHLPHALAAFRQAFPALELQLEVEAEPALSQMLLQHRLDLAVTARVNERAGLAYEAGFDEPLVVVAQEDPAELLAQAPVYAPTLIAFREGCPYRTMAQRWLESRRIACARVLSFSTYGAVLGCAAAGMGIAVVPRRLVENQAQAYQLKACRPRDLAPATSYFVFREDWRPGTEPQALMQELRRSARRPLAPL
ncbi:LysR family transcriptional regulator [Variovorax sp. OV700]|uniref:LysR family transcriptional regulator n=1 Tax=Variovorax sp. OV700 TaxID=1882826 RepID=UPI00088CE270|nr:LysR family transcriptional regulator [Variovorax sp. OV700]SDI18598.1 transcriptional regulator, LysR family [Variovorax sp. OV700]